MANLTLAVDTALIRRARMRAIQDGTSVSALVRGFLQQYVEGSPPAAAAPAREAAALQLLQLMDAATAAARADGAATPPADPAAADAPAPPAPLAAWR